MTTNNTTIDTIFTCKEHYLAFRAAWAKAVNDKDVKITAAHHMLYNILRGRAHDKGFTPITRTSKLENGFRINEGLYRAARELRCPSNLISVFDGTVTLEMIGKLDAPEVKAMESDYGPYKKVAQLIINSDIANKPVTFADIYELFETTTQKAA